MKAQAKEEKQRRQIEKKKLTKEMELRKLAEREKQQLEQQFMQLQTEMRNISENLVYKCVNNIYFICFLIANFCLASFRRNG